MKMEITPKKARPSARVSLANAMGTFGKFVSGVAAVLGGALLVALVAGFVIFLWPVILAFLVGLLMMGLVGLVAMLLYLAIDEWRES